MKQHKIEMDPASLKIMIIQLKGHADVKYIVEQNNAITNDKTKEIGAHIRKVEMEMTK